MLGPDFGAYVTVWGTMRGFVGTIVRSRVSAGQRALPGTGPFRGEKMRAAVRRVTAFIYLLAAFSAPAQQSSRTPVAPIPPAKELGPATTQTADKAADAVKAPVGIAPMPTAAPVDPKTYDIGAEDILVVKVWREPDLTGAVQVRPDGKITLPLVG